MKNSKSAFTLAEVLITLGIIGVVAALTMPSLINKYQEMALKQQFKKVYNTISNAQLKAYSENDNNPYSCYYGIPGGCAEYAEDGSCARSYEFSINGECPKFYDALKSSLNVVKVCDDNALANGCISKYMKGINLVNRENNPDLSDEDADMSISGCSGFFDNYIKNVNPTWVLADGTIIGFYPVVLGKIFWVDINGQKKPNKWGYDIFAFQFREVRKGIVKIEGGGCMVVEKGGKSVSKMINDI